MGGVWIKEEDRMGCIECMGGVWTKEEDRMGCIECMGGSGPIYAIR